MIKVIKKHPIEFVFYALMFSILAGVFAYKYFSVSSDEKVLLAGAFVCGAMIHMLTTIVGDAYDSYYISRKN